MKIKLACADFTFPILPHDQVLHLISLLGIKEAVMTAVPTGSVLPESLRPCGGVLDLSVRCIVSVEVPERPVCHAGRLFRVK